MEPIFVTERKRALLDAQKENYPDSVVISPHTLVWAYVKYAPEYADSVRRIIQDYLQKYGEDCLVFYCLRNTSQSETYYNFGVRFGVGGGDYCSFIRITRKYLI